MNQELPQQKKKMSKGCFWALIIVGVLFILAVIAIVYVCSNVSEISQWGTTMVTQEVKKIAAENPQPGVDTVRVNAAADAFLERVRAEQEPDAERLARYIQSVQYIPRDDIVDSVEAQQFVTAVSTAYPELADEVPPPVDQPVDTTGGAAMPEDTAAVTE